MAKINDSYEYTMMRLLQTLADIPEKDVLSIEMNVQNDLVDIGGSDYSNKAIIGSTITIMVRLSHPIK